MVRTSRGSIEHRIHSRIFSDDDDIFGFGSDTDDDEEEDDDVLDGKRFSPTLVH
jgi:hypothetical protein